MAGSFFNDNQTKLCLGLLFSAFSLAVHAIPADSGKAGVSAALPATALTAKEWSKAAKAVLAPDWSEATFMKLIEQDLSLQNP